MRGEPFVTRGANARLSMPTPLRQLKLNLDSFAWEALVEESQRLGVSVEEIATFSVLYYLADVDSGRVAREIPRRPMIGPAE